MTFEQYKRLLEDTSRAQEAMSRALVCNQDLVRHEWLGGNSNSVPPPELEVIFQELHACAKQWAHLDSLICLQMCSAKDVQ